MTLRNQLLENPVLEYQNQVFFQKDIPRHNSFEEAYVKLREKENRLHSDAMVKKLPEIDSDHPNKKEWEMRKSTLHQLVKYLQKSETRNVLELGCGNGWLAHHLATTLKAEICGIDVNEVELLQAGRVFSGIDNLCFVYADIFNSSLRLPAFQTVILSGSIQYFANIEKLFTALFNVIDSKGTIYIADSPIYHSLGASISAKNRSQLHFDSLGFPAMTDQYFHHTFNEFSRLNFNILYNPKSVASLIKRKILKNPLSVFPIICVTK